MKIVTHTWCWPQVTLRIALCAAILTLANWSQFAVARADAGPASLLTPKPTIVLVHGAWADASSWDAVILRLQHDGYTVTATANPLLGLAADSAYLASYLKSVSGPVILVGHSYGGAVITNAAVGVKNVKALVFIDAFVPDVGESVLQLATAERGSAFAAPPASVFNFVQYAGAPAGDVDLYIKPTMFHAVFANDLAAGAAGMLASTQRPLTFSAAAAPSGTPAWKTVPSWYLVGTADHVLPPKEQLKMAKRAHAHTVVVDASHLSMVSHPDAAEDLILDAARGSLSL